MIFRRLIPSLLIASALVSAASARSADPTPDVETTSHGATDCDDDGINIGYNVSFFDNTTPSGYRVTHVVVSGIDARCNGHDLKVALMSGADTLGSTSLTAINGATMVMPLTPRPLAQDVDAVYAELDDQVVPPAPAPSETPTPTPSPGQSTVSPPSTGGGGGGGTSSPTPTPATSTSPSPSTSVSPEASASPTPEASPSPTPDASIRPPLPPDNRLPDTTCRQSANVACGSTGDDTISISDGTVIAGPGSDSITVASGPGSSDIEIRAGRDDDTIDVTVSADSTSVHKIRLLGGPGDDVVRLSFGFIERGAVVEIWVYTQGGADKVIIPAFLPPGVTVQIAGGSQDDAVLTRGSQLAAIFDVDAMTRTSRGYAVSGDRGNDVLNGGLGPDRIAGRGGDDELHGASGDDRLVGGAGNDRLFGGSGSDRLGGGRGRDHLDGGTGDDVLRAGRGHDRLVGGSGNDRLLGGGGSDVLNGGAGDDELRGGSGEDRLDGQAGWDTLFGGPGPDRCYGMYDFGSMTGCQVHLR